MKFDSKFFGAQAFGADDRSAVGEIFGDVKAAMFRNAYYFTWGEDGAMPLPTYAVTLRRVLRGLLPGGKLWQFKAAAERAVDSRAILRWGKDGWGFRRLLHPNGVCLFGRWEIDQASPYSGYFAEGSEALIVARYSTCCTETRRGNFRSLSLVGALFPTTDEEHTDRLPTASFITQEDLGGERTSFINDAVLRNAPDTSPLRRGVGLPILLLTGAVFKLVDRVPTVRQLYEIAELGKPVEAATNAPEFMQLTVDPDQPRIEGNALDFRDEILGQIYDAGSPDPKRTLRFNIEVTNDGKAGGLLHAGEFANWQRVGSIEFTEAVASYNSDFVVHIPHPKWRLNRNDPRTTVRAAG